MKYSLSLIVAILLSAVIQPVKLWAEPADGEPSQSFWKDKFKKVKNAVVPWAKTVGNVTKNEFKRAVATAEREKAKANKKPVPATGKSSKPAPFWETAGRGGPVEKAGRGGGVKKAIAGDTCSPICSRVDKCGLWNYDSCMDQCKSNDDDPSENMAQAKWSCQKLASEMGIRERVGPGSASRSGSGEWSCRAVGAYVNSDGSGSPDYSSPQNVDVTKWGRTHDVAYKAAIDDCMDMLNLSANSTLSPGSLVTSECQILRCSR